MKSFWKKPTRNHAETNIPIEPLLAGVGTPYLSASFEYIQTRDPVVNVRTNNGRWHSWVLSETSPCVLREILRLIGRELAEPQLWWAVSNAMRTVQQKYPDSFEQDPLLVEYLNLLTKAELHGTAVQRVHRKVKRLLREHTGYRPSLCQLSDRTLKNVQSRGRDVDMAHIDEKLNVIMRFSNDHHWFTINFRDLKPCVMQKVLPFIALGACQPAVRQQTLASLDDMRKGIRTFNMSMMLKGFHALVREMEINKPSLLSIEQAVHEFTSIDFSKDIDAVCEAASTE